MTNAERHKVVEKLFHQALELTIDERTEFVRQACPEDVELQEEVLTLLSATPPSILKASLEDFAAFNDLEALDRIGPYHVLREIGRGGMGVVYLANRDDGTFEKQVALKLVKRGLDTDEILRRFRYERQILAGLEHPNIARLYDGGRSQDGRPYLAMEYIDGMPITAYCDDKHLDIDSRLQLFLTVCEAVQYAHSKLVVHRDIKPSNVLVTSDGTIKLLDFGIAKLLDEEGQSGTPKTRTGMQVMTPEYASPEQLRGEPATTSVDVYALGVMLYELLTGRRPGKPDTTTERPSARVLQGERHTSHEGASKSFSSQYFSKLRRVTPERLRRRLEGDLDTITLKALRPEASRRYVSAEALLEDIKRHLAGLPVAARADTLSYRTRKFIQRHRLAVTVVSSFLLILTLFVVSTVRQEQRMKVERDKAEEVASFLETLFTAADPSEPEAGRPDTLRARELLARGIARIENDLGNQPAVQARLFTVIGNVHTNLGLYDQADSLIEKGLVLRRHAEPFQPLDLAESESALASLRTAQSDLETAERMFRQAIAKQREGDVPQALLTSLSGLAYCLQRQGGYEEAEMLLEEAVLLSNQIYDPGDPRRFDAPHRLAVLYEDISEYREAEQMLREILEEQLVVFDGSHASVAATMNDLSLVLRDQEFFEEAEEFARKAMHINTALYGPEHPNVATNLENLGAALIGQERFVEAESAYRSALSIFDAIWGGSHQKTIIARTHLAELMRQTKQFGKAVVIYSEVVEHFQRSDPDNPGIGIVSALMANVYLDDKRFLKADSLYRFAIDEMTKVFPENHIRIGRALHGQGRSLMGMGQFERAEGAFEKAMQIFNVRQQHVDLASQSFVELYITWGKPEKAEAYQNQK